MKKPTKGYRRWHVINGEGQYVHGGCSTKAYALKIARVLSETMNIYVMDKLTNAIVWGK